MSAHAPYAPIRGLSVAEAAAYWLSRQDAGALTTHEERAFTSWLAADPAHASAFKKAGASWALFEDADRDDPHVTALRASALSQQPRPKRSAHIAIAAGGLAAAAAAIALVILPLAPADPTLGLDIAGAPDFATKRGERTEATLPDGTAVTLNTDTALDVVYTPDRRYVHLLRGQAFFDVAKNPARPFVVAAADRTVTALGTAFEVRLDEGRFSVILVEGEVAVERTTLELRAPAPAPPVVELEAPDAAPAERPALEPEPTLLKPGQELIAALGVAEEVSRADIARDLRWRDGFVEFHDEPLSSAIAEMNRYARTPVIVRDPRVADLRVSGVFRTGQPEHFVETISEILPVRIARGYGQRVELVWSGENVAPG